MFFIIIKTFFCSTINDCFSNVSLELQLKQLKCLIARSLTHSFMMLSAVFSFCLHSFKSCACLIFVYAWYYWTKSPWQWLLTWCSSLSLSLSAIQKTKSLHPFQTCPPNWNWQILKYKLNKPKVLSVYTLVGCHPSFWCCWKESVKCSSILIQTTITQQTTSFQWEHNHFHPINQSMQV